ncbi:MAG: hypothetical protein ABSC94_08360 [Polyangiaceae bacterium]|jgi:putative mRNA 3-end processing factor
MSGPVGALGVDVDGAGICLRAIDLWLDPIRPPGGRNRVFVSHVHALSDAVPPDALLSLETSALGRALRPDRDVPPGLHWSEVVELAIRPDFGGGRARLSIVPAGHVLGAAQLVIDHPRGRFAYTGDWSSDEDATRPQGAVVTCDEILVTTSFALPIFQFDALKQTLSSLTAWCEARLAGGARPTVLVLNPGPAQSVIRALTSRGIAVVATDEIRATCEAYKSLGVAVGPVGTLCGPRGASVLVAPASARATDFGALTSRAVAYASGWALLDSAVERKRADAAFVLADQADHDGLVSLIERSGAISVHLARGEARAFASVLRRRMDRLIHVLDLGPIDDRAAS